MEMLRDQLAEQDPGLRRLRPGVRRECALTCQTPGSESTKTRMGRPTPGRPNRPAYKTNPPRRASNPPKTAFSSRYKGSVGTNL